MVLLAAFAFGGALFASAQTKVTVVDTSGDAVIGASVVEKGTRNGGVTDMNGTYTINVQSNNPIVISYVGMKTQEQSVKGKKMLRVVLQDDNTTLNDVVVIGYGTMKRKDLTGAVASVTGEKLAANPVSTVAEALQGQLPGVNVISQDGRPGGTMSIRVRGGGSITQSNEPLYIVDGVQVSSIDDIAADNIESIDVLKDAASTAIYGARGANGVILITTKSAKEGRTTVKYNGYYQIRQEPAKLDIWDAYSHVLHQWSYATALGATYADNVAKFYGLGSNYGNHLNDYKNVSSHNWMDDVMDTAHSMNHDISVSGGTQHTKYYASLSYNNNEGTLINSGFRRWSGNFKLSQDITSNLKWDMDARYGEVQWKGAQFGFATQAYRFNPIDSPLGSANPTDLGMGSANAQDDYNPVSILNDYSNLTNRNRIGVNNALTWSVIKGLTLKSELYLSRNWSQTERWDGGHTNGQSYNLARLSNSNGYNIRWDTTVSYDVQGLGEEHKVNVMLGNEVLSSKSRSSYIQGTGYPSEWDSSYAFANMKLASSTVPGDEVSSTMGTPNHTVSWFGRANYSFLDRYLFTATLRADGSSKFRGDNKWGYFPAAAAAWRLSDEPFLAGSRAWLDNLKFRVSFGTSGNDGIDSGLFDTLWQTSSAVINGVTVPTYVPADCLGNPDLKWETTVSRNIGLDFGFWNGKLRGTIDFYWNTTKDVLMRVPCDATTGFSYQYQNVGQTSNKGIELTLNYEILRNKDYNLSFGATINHNKNNVDKLVDGVVASAHTGWGSTMRVPYYDYLVQVDEPVGLIQGLKSAGIYTVDDFTVANGVWTLKPGVPDYSATSYAGGDAYKLADGQTAFPGMAKFEDLDGDGTVTTSDVDIIGRTQPKLTGGFNFNGRYKDLDFSANFTYQIGGDVYNANVMHALMGNKDTGLGQARLAEVADCWKMYAVNATGDLYAVTDPTELATLNAGAKYALPYSEYGICSSQFIEDASYLRLQTLTIGYTFPKGWTNFIGISRARIYATAGNLFCISGYSGLDPDVNVSPSADSSYSGFPTPNYDYLSYPKSRTFTFGLNVTF
jgi:TonB-linked SusC/RagA family outer membrane protein